MMFLSDANFENDCRARATYRNEKAFSYCRSWQNSRIAQEKKGRICESLRLRR